MIEPCTAAPAAAEVVGRVLVVDDEPKNRELLKALLEAQGHEVSEAVDGQEGLSATIEGLPDVVLLDVMMPNLDGLEVCRRLKSAAKTASIPVLLVTSLSIGKNDSRESRRAPVISSPSPSIPPIWCFGCGMPLPRNSCSIGWRDSTSGSRSSKGMRDNLVHMIIHDLRSPLAGVYTYLQLLDLELDGVLDPSGASTSGQSIAILNRF